MPLDSLQPTVPGQGSNLHPSTTETPLILLCPSRNSSFHFFFFFLFRAVSEACGSSWARGPFRAATADLRHSHSNARSEPHPASSTYAAACGNEQGQGWNPHPHGSIWVLNPLSHNGNSGFDILKWLQRSQRLRFQENDIKFK